MQCWPEKNLFSTTINIFSMYSFLLVSFILIVNFSFLKVSSLHFFFNSSVFSSVYFLILVLVFSFLYNILLFVSLHSQVLRLLAIDFFHFVYFLFIPFWNFLNFLRMFIYIFSFKKSKTYFIKTKWQISLHFIIYYY